MELNDLLLELSNSFSPRKNKENGEPVVSKKTINDKLIQNGFSNIEVKPQAGPEIKYNDDKGQPGEGAIPLECKKSPTHTLINKGKFTFNKLLKKFQETNPNKKELCNTCADEKKIPTTGTSQSELDVVTEIEKFMQNVINKNKDVDYKIHFGRDKYKTNILTTNSEQKEKNKRHLDYDIYIEDKKDGSKNIAINVDGPSHRIRNTSVRLDDIKRTVENYKNSQSFVILPDTKAGESDFQEKINEIKRFLLSAYNAWGGFNEDALRKKLEKRGLSPEAINDYISQKKGKHEERLDTANEKAKYGLKDESVRKKINELIFVLLNNNQNYDYNGKHADLIDYLRKDPSSSKSFAYYNNSWKELEGLKNRDEIQNWINAHQAKNSKWLFKNGAGGVKLFEEKK